MGARFLAGEDLADREVSAAFAADLLSDVLAMVRGSPGVLLLTGAVTSQVVRVAEVMSLAAVLFVRGKLPTKPVVDYAASVGIPLLATPRTMYETCGLLWPHGLPPAKRKPLPFEHEQASSSPP
ncbi:MAG: transcriptional regulator [Candidatus Bipolaricaulaceae bacterium]